MGVACARVDSGVMLLSCEATMKNVLRLMLCFMLVSNIYGGQGLSEQFPLAIKSSLDRRFPGWKFLEVSEEIRDFFKKEVGPDARPELIKGDFDGDELSDYAMLIEHGEVVNEHGEAIAAEAHLVVFLKRGNKYKFYELDDPGEYLMLGIKGTDGFDFQADKKFKYANDAIEVGIFEKAGWTYIYEDGKFRYIYSAD